MGEERETNQDGKEEESFERVGLSENEVLDHYEQDQQQLDPYERSPENSIPGKIAIQFYPWKSARLRLTSTHL